MIKLSKFFSLGSNTYRDPTSYSQSADTDYSASDGRCKTNQSNSSNSMTSASIGRSYPALANWFSKVMGMISFLQRQSKDQQRQLHELATLQAIGMVTLTLLAETIGGMQQDSMN